MMQFIDYLSMYQGLYLCVSFMFVARYVDVFASSLHEQVVICNVSSFVVSSLVCVCLCV